MINLKSAAYNVLKEIVVCIYGLLQKEKSIEDMITRSKNKIIGMIQPLIDDIPEQLKYFKNERFLQFNSDFHDENRIIIFLKNAKSIVLAF